MRPRIDDEQAPLLPSSVEEVSPSPPSAEEGYGTLLRRHSSSLLPPYHEQHKPTEEPSSSLAIWTVVPFSLLGVFVANADGSLVVASSQQIASEFNALANASWIVTSFVLAQCATQPLYGKLSDIFGRKSNLTVSYLLFAAGCFLCGIGRTYGQVLAGRAISGMGGAGMTALVSIIIADMVPVREVASWRSYVNVAATGGRAVGGPVGGWLCDTIGWRWCFYWQVPLTIIGLGLILWKLPTKRAKALTDGNESKFSEKLKRVDVAGAIALVTAIISFLITLDFAAQELPLAYTIVPIAIFFPAAILFCIIESRWAKEPILPLELLTKRATSTTYLLGGLQQAAQFSFYYSVPVYFQVASGSTVADAGLRLTPAVAGNAAAGLICGYIISKTGRYKYLTLVGTAIGCLGYILILVRWRGQTSWLETLYVFFGGFASGTNQSTTFVHLFASLDEKDIAIAGTNLYLAQNLFLLIGLQSSTAVLRARLRADLETDLDGFPHKKKIIRDAVSSVHSLRDLPASIRDIVTRAYLDGLSYTLALSLALATTGLLVAMTLKEKRL